MKKKGIVFGLLLSFLAGIMLGVSGGIFFFPKIFSSPRPSGQNDKDMAGGPRPLPPGLVREKIMNRLEKKLELTKEQKVQVEKEVKIFAEELDNFHNSNRDELKSMYDSFISKLSKLIPEEKIERLRKISGEISNQPPPQEKRLMRGPEDQRPPPRGGDQQGDQDKRPQPEPRQ